ncbi:hypothetical protein I6B53_06735 [Schaalia sp. 19OD2882]|uniref:hypothetical protein n=1 Tax=Schaalia sp. 19OD2882 TaxID=2794089 RepID=UPI001C1ED233|nr:hypothetical protein [Schaalia sp. 19OD2882]QWW18848.1 hypothetical protein I6B53_06735 [Schaalia sp. 19OD2882]
MSAARILLVIALVAVGVFVLDRLALWAEAKGWVYWRRRSSSSSGSAFSAISEIFVTGDSHVSQEAQACASRVLEVDSGAPPRPQESAQTLLEVDTGALVRLGEAPPNAPASEPSRPGVG